MTKIKNPKILQSLIVTVFFIIFFISFFRFANADETIYLRNIMILSENIKHLQLFGQYSTGLHGFIFTIPVSLIYLFTGPSVTIATIYNIILTILTIVLLYKIILRLIKNKSDSLSVCLLVLTNYYFFITSTTFLKETQSILSLLIFLYILFFNKSKYKNLFIGLSLLIILDSKEYLFFTLLPAYFLWIITNELTTKNNFRKNILNIFIKFLITLLPSIIWFILMFFTPFIPINMFFATMIGFIKNNFGYVKSTFSYNSISNFVEKQTISQSIQPIINTSINISYIKNIYILVQKIFLPRSFSIISIPKIIIIPAIYSSVIFFKKYFKKNKKELLILPLFFWFYLFIYIIRTSHGRYLIPIVPISYFFYILYLTNINKNKKTSLNILLLSLIFSFIGLYFEYKYILIKFLINIIIISLTFLLLKKQKFKNQITFLIVFFISFFSLGTALFSSYSIGQIGQFFRWGYNGESYKITQLFNNDEKVLFNSIENWSELPYFYRKDTNADPEWHWELANWVPKKYMLKIGNQKNTFNFNWETNEELKNKIIENKIDKIAIIKSTIPYYKFPMQEKIEELKTLKWIKLLKIESLKNKNIYIFKVIHE